MTHQTISLTRSTDSLPTTVLMPSGVCLLQPLINQLRFSELFHLCCIAKWCHILIKRR